MKKLLLAALVAVFSFPVYAARNDASITTTTGLATVATITEGAKNDDPRYEASVNLFGTFNACTVHWLLSTDGGTTKSAIQYASSTPTGTAARQSTAADNLSLEWRWPSGTASTIFYASVSGCSSAPTLTIDWDDNL